MTYTRPEIGTEAWRHYSAGAKEEHRLTVEGMTDDAKDFYIVVQQLAQQGYSVRDIVPRTSFIYTANWTLRDRLRLAWMIVRQKW
ncbi:hypothetical protein E3_0180 [Rhodococcus phage E3]|uniref:hypothetical protein n=1 Tax=Rhodococcus phage E3 TaxID=1007869 RepID=UPI0002C69825|nr:hypothetical protein M176_gp019 [Rhodococcus phage E3]AEQ20929.1 hypothetical protein E3_0180 [Rhodococcus phage E3]